MNGMIPPALAATIADVHPQGAEWLARFPTQLEEWQSDWGLALEQPFPNLSYNYAAPGTQADGRQIVLKAGPPSTEFQSEIRALQRYGGRGAVRLLAADAEHGAMLLERVLPGNSLLEETNDGTATEIAAQVMQQLWRAGALEKSAAETCVAGSSRRLHEPFRFVTVADWAAGLQRLRVRFDGKTGPLPVRLVEKAERLFEELLASMAAPVLLHGDLHHENILASHASSHLSTQGQRWLAIDPKGVWGEPAYEPGAWLRNPMSMLDKWTDPQAILNRRLDQFAEHLMLDRKRIAAWGFAQAILSAWWSLEDHPASVPGEQHAGHSSQDDGCRRALAVAEWLDPLTR